MNDYKMEIYRGSKVKKTSTRIYDLEGVLKLGRTSFSNDRKITKIIFIQVKQNNKVILKKNLLRTKYPDLKISTLCRTKYPDLKILI